MGMKKAPIKFSPSIYGSYSKHEEDAQTLNRVNVVHTFKKFDHEDLNMDDLVLYEKHSDGELVWGDTLSKDHAEELLNTLYREGFKKKLVENAPAVKWFNE